MVSFLDWYDLGMRLASSWMTIWLPTELLSWKFSVEYQSWITRIEVWECDQPVSKGTLQCSTLRVVKPSSGNNPPHPIKWTLFQTEDSQQPACIVHTQRKPVTRHFQLLNEKMLWCVQACPTSAGLAVTVCVSHKLRLSVQGFNNSWLVCRSTIIVLNSSQRISDTEELAGSGPPVHNIMREVSRAYELCMVAH